MPFSHIEQISAWLAATDIAELELRGPDGYLHLRKERGGVIARRDEPQIPQPVAVTVTAPTVGVFLHRHPLHTAPLVSAGAQVRAHQPLGLLQIGALLLPVIAPTPGIVAGLWEPHGKIVGFGTPLVELHPLAG